MVRYLLLVTVIAAVPSLAGDSMSADSADVQWFRDAKFGVFICWGPCSIAEGEIGWSRMGPRPGIGPAPTEGVPLEVYDNLYREFAPTRFDAREWARLVRASGARYVIFLTRHHDGFAMFDTTYSDYKVTNTPFGRDVTAELADALHAEGIRIFWYYSQPDWCHPDYLTENHARYQEYLFGQVRELLTNYGHIEGMWFDGLQGNAETWSTPALFAMIRELQPGILINNRAGVPGDFDTPEQTIGSFQLGRPWESCMTMSIGWSWRGADAPVKSLRECLHLLIRCAGGGGNLALDTGPMPDGRIPPAQAENYRGMGRWLERYGESIYGTTGGPYMPGMWGACTRKGTTVYLHVLDWAGREELTLPALGAPIVSAKLLTGGDGRVTVGRTRLRVFVGKQDQDAIDTIVALRLASSADDLPAVPWLDPSVVSQGKPGSASSEWSEGYTAAMAFDGDMGTRWGGEPESTSGWLAVDLGRPITFDHVTVREDGWDRVRRFELQVESPEGWRTFHEGTALGHFELDVPPVTARKVRLNVLEATDVPTIWEFQVRKAPD